MSIRRYQRIYMADEDNRLHLIPEARYRRLRTGKEAAYLYAGRTIRFAETMIGLNKDGEQVFALAFFPVVHFGGDGRIDTSRHDREMALTRRIVALEEDSEWRPIYEAERKREFTWQPDPAVLQKLRRIQLTLRR